VVRRTSCWTSSGQAGRVSESVIAKGFTATQADRHSRGHQDALLARLSLRRCHRAEDGGRPVSADHHAWAPRRDPPSTAKTALIGGSGDCMAHECLSARSTEPPDADDHRGSGHRKTAICEHIAPRGGPRWRVRSGGLLEVPVAAYCRHPDAPGRSRSARRREELLDRRIRGWCPRYCVCVRVPALATMPRQARFRMFDSVSGCCDACDDRAGWRCS